MQSLVEILSAYNAHLRHFAPPPTIAAAAGLATTPLDVIKTRLMAQGTSKAYANVFDCAAKIYREEGGKALLRGWEPRVTWIALGGCIFFGSLEACKKALVPAEALEQSTPAH